MTTGQLFFLASASAPAMTFLACSRLIGAPYGGGAWAARGGGGEQQRGTDSQGQESRLPHRCPPSERAVGGMPPAEGQ